MREKENVKEIEHLLRESQRTKARDNRREYNVCYADTELQDTNQTGSINPPEMV